jgi:photosystem II stability/assembly factor-like uncharacterized protein
MKSINIHNSIFYIRPDLLQQSKPKIIYFFLISIIFIVNIISQSTRWIPQVSGVTTQFDHVDFINPNTGIVTETSNYILRTYDGGANWTRIYTGINGQYAVKFKDIYTVFLFGYTTLYKSVNGGLNFTISANLGNSVSEIFIFGEKIILAGSTFIFKSTDAGSNWASYPAPNSPYNFCFIDEFTGWSVGAQYYPPPNPNLYIYNRIHKTTNGGTNWTLLSEVTSQSQPMYQNIRFCNINTGYIGGLYGCRKSTNGGGLWSIVKSGLSTEVFPVNIDSVWLGVLGSGLDYTTNGGINWIRDSVNGSIRDIKILDNNTAWAVGNNGKIFVTSTAFLSAGNSSLFMPGEYILFQNYPNPFNPSTSIEFSIPEKTFIKLAVYDIIGREVEIMVYQDMPEGTHRIDWSGAGHPSGTYFYTLDSKKFKKTKKMILVK